MLHATRGIVLHATRYAETSLVVKIYTEQSGLQSYLVKGVYSRQSKNRPALFQPLSLLDMVAYHRERRSLNTLKEVRLAHPYQVLPFDIRRSSVALFMNELVYKTVREEEANGPLFAFLWQSCLELDDAAVSPGEFPLRFALRLMEYLGIAPRNDRTEGSPVFDLREGHFLPAFPGHPDYLAGEAAVQFSELLAGRVPAAPSRFTLLDTVVRYYRLHLPGAREVQAHRILHDVLS